MGYGELLHKSEQRTISPAICVYIDANGLHELNNERGHEAGDLMLRFVAESLMEQFPKGSLYRCLLYTSRVSPVPPPASARIFFA